jgi:methionine sulfoxide reductase catalytic subunit
MQENQTMLIKKTDDIPSSEITSENLYLNRRNFLRATALAGTSVATGLLYRTLNRPGLVEPRPAPVASNARITLPTGEPANTLDEIANYNNFYEFSTNKQAVAGKARNFVTRPWTLEVNGLAAKPKTFDLDQVLALAPQEDRVYRFRCVEAWSMIIPWQGFPLATLLAQVEPLAAAKYVEFQTLFDPERMPNQRGSVLPWPYYEGLRMDEAMHPLTILAGGLYGKPLPAQNGAPLRLVVPWKYGFKSIKSIVRITLTDKQPRATWHDVAPDEYGFYSNVNPAVSHPRWSQATENRIGEWGRRDTLAFNGYGDQVAQLYTGMDLEKNF